ncbi:MAG: ATP-binding protein [Rubripirellula sp.]
MSGLPQTQASRIIDLIDAGTACLERNDREQAANQYAEASGLLFRKAAQEQTAAQKLELVKRAQQLLLTVNQLRGEAEPSASPKVAAKSPGVNHGNPHEEESDAKFVALKSKIKFNDVAGLAEVKEALHLRLIYPLRHPEKLSRYGLQSGGGMLLYGPPGTGKTMIAKAVAGELSLPFFAIKPAEILSKYFGESTQKMAELFNHARSFSNGSVIFVDEIDSIGGARGNDGASEASRRLVTQLLQELDGVQGQDEGLLFLAATNEPWLLDAALLRPGRFDEKCYVGLPDQEARVVLIGLQLKECWIAEDVVTADLAVNTDGFSGADLVCLCERAKQIPFRDAVIDGIERPLQRKDFEVAFQTVKPSVTSESLQNYQNYAAG